MKTIWILIFPYSDGGYSIEGAFTSKQAAEKYKAADKTYGMFLEIEEVEVKE